MHTVLLVIHILVTVSLIGLILIQRSDSDGTVLGGGSSNSFMSGRATATLLTRITAVLAAIFIFTSLGLTKLDSRPAHTSILDQLTATPLAPQAPGTPTKTPITTPVAPVKNTAPAVPKPQ